MSSRFVGLRIRSFDLIEVFQKAEIKQQANRARGSGRPDDAVVAAEVRIHGGSEQPKLQDDKNHDDAHHAMDDRESLLARKEPLHTMLLSMPVA
jgi:hypothetical protein